MKRVSTLILAFVLVISSTFVVMAQKTYTVQDGDELWRIARDNGITMEEIIRWNNIDNPDLIYSAQVLNVSQGDEKAAESPLKHGFCEDISLKAGKNEVMFYSEGEKVAAFIFTPENYSADSVYPALVVTPPVSGVKEQTAGIYAEKLSKEGFITLVFDPRGFGESEGRKLLLNAYNISDDIRNAVNLLESLEQVDANNLFNIGICAGAGFSAFETAYDSRINALAIISPFLTGQQDQINSVGNTTNLRTHIMPYAEPANLNYFKTGEEMIAQLVPTTKEEADAVNARPIIRGMMTYYLPGMPGDVPTWKNGLDLQSFNYVLSFSIYDHAKMFDAVPVFMVYGDEAVSTPGALEFYNQLNGEKDKLEFKGAGHFDLYWMPEYVDPAVDAIAEYFSAHME
ncbi:MAG: LysM peptidoglycan-binding domain-containing protein [Clostridia bacterium]|nr:LysM peptidoglycan-binding domain-containing protein [Clostridia bacterium]